VARVLMLSLLFPPDNVSTAHLMGDVCEDLAAAGHDVTVITTTPHYNRDAAAEAAQPLARHWGGLVQTSRYRGIRVFHTLMPRKGPSSVTRVLAWAWFHALSVVVGTTSVGRVDVLIAPSPPLTMGVAAWLLGRLKRAPYIYSVLELHPDIAISLGLVRRPWVIRLLYALEQFVYARATRLTVIANAMLARVIAKGVPPGKVTLVPNFVDTSALLAVARPNAFSRAHGLDQAFVVSYAGNVGPAQGLEALVDAAAALRDVPQVRVVVVGGGILWQALADRIAAARLDNVLLLPHHSFETVPAIYGASDVCVVAQSATTTSDAVPSKVYRIMGAGKPVLAMTVPGSDLAALVRESGCGAVVSASDPHAIAHAIRSAAVAPDEWRAMGDAGRAHVREHYSRASVTARYNTLVNELTAGRS
jgi:colanic acid biosynthesis glycosyl transferase WcaI